MFTLFAVTCVYSTYCKKTIFATTFDQQNVANFGEEILRTEIIEFALKQVFSADAIKTYFITYSENQLLSLVDLVALVDNTFKLIHVILRETFGIRILDTPSGRLNKSVQIVHGITRDIAELHVNDVLSLLRKHEKTWDYLKGQIAKQLELRNKPFNYITIFFISRYYNFANPTEIQDVVFVFNKCKDVFTANWLNTLRSDILELLEDDTSVYLLTNGEFCFLKYFFDFDREKEATNSFSRKIPPISDNKIKCFFKNFTSLINTIHEPTVEKCDSTNYKNIKYYCLIEPFDSKFIDQPVKFDLYRRVRNFISKSALPLVDHSGFSSNDYSKLIDLFNWQIFYFVFPETKTMHMVRHPRNTFDLYYLHRFQLAHDCLFKDKTKNVNSMYKDEADKGCNLSMIAKKNRSSKYSKNISDCFKIMNTENTTCKLQNSDTQAAVLSFHNKDTLPEKTDIDDMQSYTPIVKSDLQREQDSDYPNHYILDQFMHLKTFIKITGAWEFLRCSEHTKYLYGIKDLNCSAVDKVSSGHDFVVHLFYYLLFCDFLAFLKEISTSDFSNEEAIHMQIHKHTFDLCTDIDALAIKMCDIGIYSILESLDANFYQTNIFRYFTISICPFLQQTIFNIEDSMYDSSILFKYFAILFTGEINTISNNFLDMKDSSFICNLNILSEILNNKTSEALYHNKPRFDSGILQPNMKIPLEIFSRDQYQFHYSDTDDCSVINFFHRQASRETEIMIKIQAEGSKQKIKDAQDYSEVLQTVCDIFSDSQLSKSLAGLAKMPQTLHIFDLMKKNPISSSSNSEISSKLKNLTDLKNTTDKDAESGDAHKEPHKKKEVNNFMCLPGIFVSTFAFQRLSYFKTLETEEQKFFQLERDFLKNFSDSGATCTFLDKITFSRVDASIRNKLLLERVAKICIHESSQASLDVSIVASYTTFFRVFYRKIVPENKPDKICPQETYYKFSKDELKKLEIEFDGIDELPEKIKSRAPRQKKRGKKAVVVSRKNNTHHSKQNSEGTTPKKQRASCDNIASFGVSDVSKNNQDAMSKNDKVKPSNNRKASKNSTKDTTIDHEKTKSYNLETKKVTANQVDLDSSNMKETAFTSKTHNLLVKNTPSTHESHDCTNIERTVDIAPDFTATEKSDGPNKKNYMSCKITDTAEKLVDRIENGDLLTDDQLLSDWVIFNNKTHHKHTKSQVDARGTALTIKNKNEVQHNHIDSNKRKHVGKIRLNSDTSRQELTNSCSQTENNKLKKVEIETKSQNKRTEASKIATNYNKHADNTIFFKNSMLLVKDKSAGDRDKYKADSALTSDKNYLEKPSANLCKNTMPISKNQISEKSIARKTKQSSDANSACLSKIEPANPVKVNACVQTDQKPRHSFNHKLAWITPKSANDYKEKEEIQISDHQFTLHTSSYAIKNNENESAWPSSSSTSSFNCDVNNYTIQFPELSKNNQYHNKTHLKPSKVKVKEKNPSKTSMIGLVDDHVPTSQNSVNHEKQVHAECQPLLKMKKDASTNTESISAHFLETSSKDSNKAVTGLTNTSPSLSDKPRPSSSYSNLTNNFESKPLHTTKIYSTRSNRQAHRSFSNSAFCRNCNTSRKTVNNDRNHPNIASNCNFVCPVHNPYYYYQPNYFDYNRCYSYSEPYDSFYRRSNYQREGSFYEYNQPLHEQHHYRFNHGFPQPNHNYNQSQPRQYGYRNERRQRDTNIDLTSKISATHINNLYKRSTLQDPEKYSETSAKISIQPKIQAQNNVNRAIMIDSDTSANVPNQLSEKCRNSPDRSVNVDRSPTCRMKQHSDNNSSLETTENPKKTNLTNKSTMKKSNVLKQTSIQAKVDHEPKLNQSTLQAKQQSTKKQPIQLVDQSAENMDSDSTKNDQLLDFTVTNTQNNKDSSKNTDISSISDTDQSLNSDLRADSEEYTMSLPKDADSVVDEYAQLNINQNFTPTTNDQVTLLLPYAYCSLTNGLNSNPGVLYVPFMTYTYVGDIWEDRTMNASQFNDPQYVTTMQTTLNSREYQE